MQFQVPQFIEIEDKVFGPFTIRQFIYLAGGGGLCYLCYAILPTIFAFLAIAVIATFSLMLAFYKYNSRPFIEFVESAFKYAITNRLYVWKKEEKPIEQKKVAEIKKASLVVPKVTESKLRDLASRLDIKEHTENLADDGTGAHIELSDKI